jgi:hypothetical protein
MHIAGTPQEKTSTLYISNKFWTSCVRHTHLRIHFIDPNTCLLRFVLWCLEAKQRPTYAAIAHFVNAHYPHSYCYYVLCMLTLLHPARGRTLPAMFLQNERAKRARFASLLIPEVFFAHTLQQSAYVHKSNNENMLSNPEQRTMLAKIRYAKRTRLAELLILVILLRSRSTATRQCARTQ